MAHRYEFHRVAPLEAFADGSRVAVSIGAWAVLVCAHEGRYYGVENRCSHQDQPLTAARIRRGHIICPVHGARFELETGTACNPPAIRPIRTFPVQVIDGWLEVGVPIDHDGQRG